MDKAFNKPLSLFYHSTVFIALDFPYTTKTTSFPISNKKRHGCRKSRTNFIFL